MATLNASLNTAIARLGTFRGRTSEAAAAARQLGTASEIAEKEVRKSGETAATGGGLFTKLKTGLGLSEEGMKGLNGAMRANAVGVLLMLLQPLIQKLLDMITHSRAVQAAIQTAFRIIGEVVGAVSKYVQGVVDEVWPWISATIKTVVTVISTVVKTYFGIIRAEIEIVMAVVKTVVSVTWNAIRAVVTPVVEWIGSAIPNAWHTVSDSLSAAWGGLAGIAKAAFGAVLSVIRAPINAIIGLVNSAIDGLDGIKVSIPSWVPFVGGKSFGVDLPHIPQLAGGGIVLPRAGGTLALLGEGGQSEAVVPLSRLGQMLGGRPGPAPAGPGRSGLVVQNYYEAEHGSARRTAEELMFLAKARG
jgi:hypothetical protein